MLTNNQHLLYQARLSLQKLWMGFATWQARLMINSHWYTWGKPLAQSLRDLAPRPYFTESLPKES